MSEHIPANVSQGSGGRGGRSLSAEDRDLWRRAMAGVSPLRTQLWPTDGADGETAAPAPPAVSPACGLTGATITPPVASQTALARSAISPAPGAGVDRRTLQRLRRGLIPPQRQIDLHQCTQEEAYEVLCGFLSASQAAGRRCVLVITGKGYRSEGRVGVLRSMVPRWLNEAPNRSRVLAHCHAQPGHGGEGALYVLLRRQSRMKE